MYEQDETEKPWLDKDGIIFVIFMTMLFIAFLCIGAANYSKRNEFLRQCFILESNNYSGQDTYINREKCQPLIDRARYDKRVEEMR